MAGQVFRGGAPKGVKVSQTLTGGDLKAANTFAAPNKVVPRKLEAPASLGSRMTVEVPAKSYSVFVFETA